MGRLDSNIVVPSWEAILSDGQVFSGADMSSWRQLMHICYVDELSIVALIHDGQEVDDHLKAVSYFIMYDQKSSLNGNGSRLRICFGSNRENGKARLQWKVISNTFSSNDINNITEIVQPLNTAWNEISIPIDRGDNYEATVKLHFEKRGT